MNAEAAPSGSCPVSALVLAARRPGVTDSLARERGVSHKCMIPLGGRIMLERVVEALLDSGCCRHVFVCIDDAAVLDTGEQLQAWRDAGLLSAVPAADNIADSVIQAGRRFSREHWPLLITTGDNALHTPDFIRDFIMGASLEPVDAALGVTLEKDVVAEIPDSGLYWHRLRDGGFSSCNLYLLNTPETLRAADIFSGGGQFGKKHWRILRAFGFSSFLLYKFRLATVSGIIRRMGKGLGLRIAPVFLPYAWGPIDVDNPHSLALTERLLAERDDRP